MAKQVRERSYKSDEDAGIVGHEMYEIPELSSLGRVFRSTDAIELTESETEYVVACTKHVMERHVVLEFCITNTLPDQLLVDARNVPGRLQICLL